PTIDIIDTSTQERRIVKRKQEETEGNYGRENNHNKSAAGGDYPPYLLRELAPLNEIRKRTYSHWQLISPTGSQMIESGFFNCNVGDRVICIYCNLVCQQWMLTDDPSEIHKLLSPDCCFVKSNLVYSTTPTRTILCETAGVPTDCEIVRIQACNQQFMEIPKRHATFATWPAEAPLQSIDDLVRAGFFYTGTKTIVTCFYCNGSLQNWGEDDNPTIEHARWFPQW
ncbi:unnamed protein product, partial [Didymodactylos carnosus]